MDEFVSYAQNFEDVMLWRALRHIEHGFYIDAGASEPELHSVTAAFYERGWSGINIEPAPGPFARLTAARPRDINVEVALGAQPGQQDFLLVDGGNGLSTLDSSRRDELIAEGWELTDIRVQICRLADICREYVKGDIHFLKIDVEGNERAVLDGAELEHWRPWVIVIEATRPNTAEANYAKWQDLLLSKQYLMVYDDGLNRFYVAAEHGELAVAFSLPPNVHDRFIRHAEYQAKMDSGKLYRQVRDLDATLQLESERLKILDSRLVSAIEERDTTIQKLSSCNAFVDILQAKIKNLEVGLDTLRAENVTLNERIEGLNGELRAVYASRSWRVTEPLRRLKDWRKRK